MKGFPFGRPTADGPAGIANLRRLFWLRHFAILGQASALLAAQFLLHMQILSVLTLAPIACLLLFNVYVGIRLRRDDEPGEGEFTLHLAVDIVTLGALLYFTGGAGNPFVFLFLLPLTVAATLLSTAKVWVLTALTVLTYSVLLYWYQPLPHAHGASAGHDFTLHVAGMWFGFLLSAVIVSYVITGMGRTVRHQDALLAKAREQALRSERLVALGTLAAGAAHELGTPLSTASLLAAEIEHETADTPSAIKARQLRDQLKRCKQGLSALSATAGQLNLSGGGSSGVAEFLEGVMREFRTRRPQAALNFHCQDGQPAQRILADRSLGLALMNILDNAADASPQHVECEAIWDERELRLHVRDRGPGLSEKAREHAGKQPYGEKAQGLGLGLFLSHGIIERMGGEVRLSERQGGGLETAIRLPLPSLDQAA